MNIVPTHKSDLDACSNLSRASNKQVEDNLIELLEWLKDINWPVANLVIERIKNIGTPLIAPVKNILLGDDEVWKYWIISGLLNDTSRDVVLSLKEELEKIAQNPTESEKAEEVNLVAAEVLEKCM